MFKTGVINTMLLTYHVIYMLKRLGVVFHRTLETLEVSDVCCFSISFVCGIVIGFGADEAGTDALTGLLTPGLTPSLDTNTCVPIFSPCPV